MVVDGILSGKGFPLSGGGLTEAPVGALLLASVVFLIPIGALGAGHIWIARNSKNLWKSSIQFKTISILLPFATSTAIIWFLTNL